MMDHPDADRAVLLLDHSQRLPVARGRAHICCGGWRHFSARKLRACLRGYFFGSSGANASNCAASCAGLTSDAAPSAPPPARLSLAQAASLWAARPGRRETPLPQPRV